jgi:diguanylate cyclase (GGDEF)-like protein
MSTTRRLRFGPFESRLGWRLFVLLLVALAVPALVLAIAVLHGLAEAQTRAREVTLGATARSVTFQTLERLLTAQATLRATASRPLDARPAEPQADGSRSAGLAAVYRLGSDGRWQAVGAGHPGDPATGSTAPPVVGPVELATIAARDRLIEQPDPTNRSAAPSVFLLHRQAADGSIWAARIDAAALWRHAGELPPGLWVCARTEDDRTLWCSDGAPADASAARPAAPSRAGAQARLAIERSLFLPSRFDAEPWTFVIGLDPARAEASAHITPAALGPVALVSVLIAAWLTLAQLRRMMSPLGQMTRTARRWAKGDLKVRANLPAGDEFGELGAAFDHMADQLQGQFAHLAILRTIDGAALAQADLDGMLAEVAQHLLRWPEVQAATVVRAAAASARGDWCRVHVDRGGLPRPATAVAASDGWADWVRTATPGESALPDGLVDRAAAGLRAADGERRATPWSWPLRSGDRALGCLVLWTAGGAPLPADPRATAGELSARLSIALDAVERESSWRHLARHDSLTGLLNRAGILEMLQAEIDAARQAGPSDDTPDGAGFALLLVDLDRFKQVNDGHGHHAGDLVLREVAARIQAALGPRGHVGRPGGDEFIVLVRRETDASADLELAATLCRVLAQPVATPDASFRLGGSVGVARFPEHGSDAAALLRRADLAMFSAKRSGRGRHALFDPALDEAARRRLWVERELQAAIERDELMLVFQPRVQVHTGRLASFEALVRWVHPTRGVISPGEFIPVAEESSLIERVGDCVIEQACAQIAAWRGTALGGVRVALNVSARQLASDRLERSLQEAMRRHAVAPEQIEIEVTESLMAEDLELTIARLRRIRDLGVSIALDDFGTGYSSMAYLQRLPVDIMKIDRSFVVDITDNPSAQAIARSIIALAGALGKSIVAEGVETAEQARWLAEAGVHELQGYLYGRPLPAPDLRHLAADRAITAAEPSCA